MGIFVGRVYKNRRRTVSGRKKLSAAVLFILGLTLLVLYFYGKLSQQVRIREENRYMIIKESLAGREEIPLEEYLVGAMAVSLPKDAELETCKAQAVILRTHVERLAGETGSFYLSYEALCQESLTGMALYDKYSGENAEQLERMETAVQETKGEILVYEEIPVELPFFALSSGKTRNGNEVFERENYPYLQSVPCEEDTFAENYSQEIVINKKVLCSRLQGIFETEEEIGLEDLQFEKDSADYVTEVIWNGKKITGESFREQLDLPSACFDVEEAENQIMIVTKGIGHGLGMSLYTADLMAGQGEDYREILRYFFPLCEIVKN